MSAIFGLLFTVGVIGFLIVYGFALYLINRRLARIEEQLYRRRFRK